MTGPEYGKQCTENGLLTSVTPYAIGYASIKTTWNLEKGSACAIVDSVDAYIIMGHCQSLSDSLISVVYPFLITSTVSLLNAILPPSRSSNAALNVVSFFLNGSRIGVDLFLRSVSTSSSENSCLKNVLGIP